jgi:hypothetical protein
LNDQHAAAWAVGALWMFNQKAIRAVVYGSCHATALVQLLKGIPGLTRCVDILPIPPVHEIAEDALNGIVETIKDVDLLIYQPVSRDYRGEQYATARLVEALPAHAMLISFGYYHFEIYTPFISAALPGMPPPPSDYVDYLLGSLMARGLPDGEIAERLLHLEGLEPYAEAMLAAAFYELRLREDRVLEGDRALDVRLAGRVHEAFRRDRLGHTMNHPTRTVMTWIADDVLSRLEAQFGIHLCGLRSLRADPLKPCQFVVAPFVKKAFGLTFADGRDAVLNNRRLRIGDYIKANRPYFDSLAPGALMKAVQTHAQPASRPWYSVLL